MIRDRGCEALFVIRGRRRGSLAVALFGRALALAAVVTCVGLLPWFSGRDPALSVLRARSAEQEATPEALAAVRDDLGLDGGLLTQLGR